jgi:hypothetical protein
MVIIWKRVNTIDSNSNQTLTSIHSMFTIFSYLQLTMDIDGDYLMAPVTDHELSHSASDQSMISSEKSHHHITNGYKICVHTCVKRGCISRKTNTILWCKEGHVVQG